MTVSLPKIKKTIRSAEVLREAGYNIPPALLQLLDSKRLESEGVAQVWECRFCNWNYESPPQVVKVSCPGEHQAKEVWSSQTKNS